MSAVDGDDLDPVDGVQVADGLWCAWVLSTHGAWPWVIVAGLDPGREHCGCGCGCCAAHDQLGPLPALYGARLRAAFRPADTPDETGGAT